MEALIAVCFFSLLFVINICALKCSIYLMVAFNQVNTVGELEVFIHVVSIKYL